MSQQINLFNPVLLKQKKIFAAVPMARALALLICGSLALGYYANQSVAALERDALSSAARLKQKQMRQVEVNMKFGARQKDKTLEARIAAAQTELQSLQQVANVLKGGEFGNTHGYSAYFKALAQQRVPGLWLTGVSISGPGNEVAVHGGALQANLVPAYINRLTHESVMRGKSFGSLQISQPLQKTALDKDAVAAEPAPFVEFSLQSTQVADGVVTK